jgi:hypothetical protein
MIATSEAGNFVFSGKSYAGKEGRGCQEHTGSDAVAHTHQDGCVEKRYVNISNIILPSAMTKYHTDCIGNHRPSHEHY